VPKIIKIGQCFTELLKNNTGTVFLRHGVYTYTMFQQRNALSQYVLHITDIMLFIAYTVLTTFRLDWSIST